MFALPPSTSYPEKSLNSRPFLLFKKSQETQPSAQSVFGRWWQVLYCSDAGWISEKNKSNVSPHHLKKTPNLSQLSINYPFNSASSLDLLLPHGQGSCFIHTKLLKIKVL